MLQSRLGRFDAKPGQLQIGHLKIGEDGVYECGPELVKEWSVDDVHPLLCEAPLDHEKGDARIGESRKIIVIRTLLDKDVREGRDSQKAANWWLLPATQFRLVSDKGKNYYPVGWLTYLGGGLSIKEAQKESGVRQATTTPSDKPIVVDWQGTKLKLWVRPLQCKFIGPATDKTKTHWSITDLIIEREWKDQKARALVVDWVYRMPKSEAPAYMVFRRVAKAAVPKPLTGKEAEAVLRSKEFTDRMLDRK